MLIGQNLKLFDARVPDHSKAEILRAGKVKCCGCSEVFAVGRWQLQHARGCAYWGCISWVRSKGCLPRMGVPLTDLSEALDKACSSFNSTRSFISRVHRGMAFGVCCGKAGTLGMGGQGYMRVGELTGGGSLGCVEA